uniref:Uncharacterized protein n=1 Tax=Mus spicilegus TaxID=10103 RepID=A0A8C6IIA2_MUSSI
MFELKNLESPKELIKVFIYGSQNNKVRANRMLQSMAERYCLRQQRGVLKLEESMKTLELGQCSEASFQSLCLPPGRRLSCGQCLVLAGFLTLLHPSKIFLDPCCAF